MDYLPKDFSELFYSRYFRLTLDSFEVGDVDDCERTQLDENNRLPTRSTSTVPSHAT
ncbi:hypothetical protein O9993_05175 [Vibrio lentus]|nr:hypothetical protein [Vibrio lentus]